VLASVMVALALALGGVPAVAYSLMEIVLFLVLLLVLMRDMPNGRRQSR